MEIRRASDRFVSEYDGVVSRHSFSFGPHYDPRNVGFGMLVCHNDDVLQPRHGYDDHPHRDLEIVTWVLEGELWHGDSEGHDAVTRPGDIQVLGAGTGVVHREHAGPGVTRFVQMWVRPDEPGLPTRYLHEPLPLGDAWTTVPGVRNSRATLQAARLSAGTTELPAAPYLHLFVARGEAVLETEERLAAGDAVRATDASGLRVTGDAELLVWSMR